MRPGRARMAPLYPRRAARVIQREPSAEVLAGLVGRAAIERHHRARAAGDPGNLGAPLLADGRDFDAVFTPVDGFFESMHGNGHDGLKILASLLRRASESIDEGASTCSSTAELRAVREKIFTTCQNVHKLSTVHPPVFHRVVSTRVFRRTDTRRASGGAVADRPD